MILPAEIRLGADKRGKGRQQEGRGEGAKEGRKVPNCEVSHTWRRAGGRLAGAACATADDDGDAVAGGGENGWEIHFQPPDSNRVDSVANPTGSLKSTPKRSQPPRIGPSIDCESRWVRFPIWSGDKGPPRRAHDDFPRGRVPRLRPPRAAPPKSPSASVVPPPLIAVGPRNEPFAINMPSSSAAS